MTYNLTDKEREFIDALNKDANDLLSKVNGALAMLAHVQGMTGEVKYKDGVLTNG